MTIQIQIRRGTAAAWTTANTLLSEGEMGLETDTDKAKIGDGVTLWNSLAYWVNPGATSGITQLTGDVTAGPGSGSQAATIANGAVTNSKVASGIDAVKIGAGSVSNTEFGYLDGVTSAIQTQFSGKQDGPLTGDVTTSGAAATIANDAVTFSKMQNISTNKLLGRSTASTGDIEQLSIGTGLSLSGGTLSSTVAPASPTTSVQFNDSGAFGGDSNLEWNNTLKYLGVQKSAAAAEAPLHAAGVSGSTVDAPASASASATLETLVDAPATYSATQITGPTTPTTVVTNIGGYINSTSGGSGSDVQDPSGTFVAQGQTWYYKVYAYRNASGLKICNPNYADIQITDSFNDASAVRVDFSAYEIPTNYDGFMVVRNDSLGSPTASFDIGTATSWTDYGSTATDAYVISQYAASGQTASIDVYQYATLNGSNYNSGSATDTVNPVADSSGSYFWTTSTWDSIVDDGFQVKTYNGFCFNNGTSASFIDYGQSTGAESQNTFFLSVFFNPFPTSLTGVTGLSENLTYGSGNLMADGSSWETKCYSYKTNPASGLNYYSNISVDSGGIADANDSSFFTVDGSYTLGGDESGVIVILYKSGSPVAGYDNGTSTTYSFSDFSSVPGLTPNIASYAGTARTFNAFGKQNSPVKYSISSVTSSLTDTNPVQGYAISHQYTGIGNADIVKVKQEISGASTIGFSLSSNPYIQSPGGGEGAGFTPTNLGYLGNGDTYYYDIFATKTINGSPIWSSTPASTSVTLPNTSSYYTISVTNAAVSGATYKARRKINSGGYVYQTYSSSPLSDLTTVAWSSSSTLTPTTSPVPAALFDRASTSTSDPANIILRNTQDGANQTLIDFQAKQSSVYTSMGVIGFKSDGSLALNNNGNIGAGNTDFGPYSSPHVRFNTSGNFFNLQGATGRHTTFKGSSSADLAKFNTTENTVYFGNGSLNYDPDAAVAIQSNSTTDSALLLYPTPGSSDAQPVMRVKNSSANNLFVIDQVGRVGIATSTTGNGNLRIGPVDSSHVQIEFASNSNLASGVVRGLSTQGTTLYWSGDASAWRKVNVGLATSTSTYFWRSDANGEATADNSLQVLSGVIVAANLLFEAKQGISVDSAKDISMGNNSRITGNIGYTYAAITANTTANVSNYAYNHTSGSAHDFTLPTAVSISGRVYELYNSGAGLVTMKTTSSQTIGGVASAGITVPQNNFIKVMADGANWIILAHSHGVTGVLDVVPVANGGTGVTTSTGTGNVVLSASPTLTGTVVAAAATLSGILTVNNDVKLGTAGNGLYVKEGTNATMGTATLASGTATVNTTKVTANSRIFLTVNGGTLTNVGSTYISARTAGTSFTITSSNVLDASNVAWLIVEPA